jgi:hypothetical protein
MIDIKIDIENLGMLGKRPISMGKEYYINGQGSFQNTANKLDFAINGKGFFVLHDKENNKIYISRNGSFDLNSENLLISNTGYFVLDGKSNLANREYIYIDANFTSTHINSNLIINKVVFSPLDLYNKVIYPFLIVYPRDITSVEIINPEYAILDEFEICEIDNYSIYRGVLEEMPLDIKTLLNKTVEYTYLSRDSGSEIETIYDMFTKKYSEIIKYTIIENDYLDSVNKLFLILKCQRRINAETQGH